MKSEKMSAADCRLIEFDTCYENSAAKYAKVRWDALSEIVREFQRVARGAIHPDLTAPAFKWETWKLDAVADISDCALPCQQIADIQHLGHQTACILAGIKDRLDSQLADRLIPKLTDRCLADASHNYI